MSPTFRYRLVHDVFVLVHTEDDPSDAEWTAWMAFLHRSLESGAVRGTVVVSHGGSPSGVQRRDLKAMSPEAQKLPLAIMMDSRVGALMVSAVGLLGQNVHGFRLSEWDAMARYLAVTSTEREALREAARELREELGIT